MTNIKLPTKIDMPIYNFKKAKQKYLLLVYKVKHSR